MKNDKKISKKKESTFFDELELFKKLPCKKLPCNDSNSIIIKQNDFDKSNLESALYKIFKHQIVLNFDEKLEIIKTISNTKNLYDSLIKIKSNVGNEFAEKYLIGFLENNGISFNDFILKVCNIKSEIEF